MLGGGELPARGCRRRDDEREEEQDDGSRTVAGVAGRLGGRRGDRDDAARRTASRGGARVGEDGDDAARRRATRGSVGERIGNGEALPSRFEQDVVRDGEAGDFRLEDVGATPSARRSTTTEAGRRRESQGVWGRATRTPRGGA